MKGATKCHKHGGRRQLDVDEGHVKVSHLPAFYRGKLSKTLQAAVDAQLSCQPHEQLALFEELAIMRGLAGDALAMHAAAEGLVEKENTPAHQLILVEAQKCVKELLVEVQRMAEGAARIVAMTKDKITPHSMQAIVHQLVRIMHEKANGNAVLEAFAQDYERAVAQTVRVVDVARGTDLTPDQVAREMDESVLGDGEDDDGETEES